MPDLNLCCKTSKLEWSAVDSDREADGADSVWVADAPWEIAGINPRAKSKTNRLDFRITIMLPVML